MMGTNNSRSSMEPEQEQEEEEEERRPEDTGAGGRGEAARAGPGHEARPPTSSSMVSLGPGLSLFLSPETGTVSVYQRPREELELEMMLERQVAAATAAEGEEEEEEEGRDEEEEEEEAVRITPMQLLRLLRGNHGLDPRFSHRHEHVVDLPRPPPMSSECDFYKQVKLDSEGLDRRDSICREIAQHQYLLDSPSAAQKIHKSLFMLPTHPCIADTFDSRVFCGNYSQDGSIFLAATQDHCLHLYDTTGSNFRKYRSVHARDVGWSVLDIAFSPDQKWFAYSTWSPYIHLCNTLGEEEHHYSFDLQPQSADRFCAFSVRFSNDNREIIAAASNGFIYIYDRDINCRVMMVDAHQDDTSAAVFADESSQIIYSGGDDGICKTLWFPYIPEEEGLNNG